MLEVWTQDPGQLNKSVNSFLYVTPILTSTRHRLIYYIAVIVLTRT